MILRRKTRGSDTCTSAGRVTAQLLLSFLAFSPAPADAARDSRSNEQAVLPLQPDFFIPSPEPPAPAEHVFVSFIAAFSLS
jgi:lipase ATG15